MKIIKVKVYFTRSEGGRKKTYQGGYPPGWSSTSIPYILYTKKEGTEPDGRTYEWVIPAVPDEIYDTMLKSDQCYAISNEEAIKYSNKCTPKVEKIRQQDNVLRVMLKKTRGETLAKEDEDLLDPNVGTGVGWALTAMDAWRRHGVQI